MSEKKHLRELADELDAFDSMLTSLVEILEEKGVLTQEEWETKIKTKVEKKDNKPYRDMQFKESN